MVALVAGPSLPARLDFITQRLEVLQRRVKCLVSLGKVETNQMVDGLAEEARAGYGAHAHLRREVLAEFEVAIISKLRDVHHDVVGALWHVVLKTDAVESLAEQVALGGVEVEDLLVIAVVEFEGGDDGFLQGSGGTHGEKVVDLLDALGDLGRGNGVAQTPAVMEYVLDSELQLIVRSNMTGSVAI